jgi:His/Glu/Gln/Arg/opine family amino acid ABC transporter permease subunit
MAAANQSPQTPSSLLTDVRFLQIVGQIVFVIILIGLVFGVMNSITTTLDEADLAPNPAVFFTRAGFDITNAPDWYTSNSRYIDAYAVGFVNTVRVAVGGLIASTVLGVLLGIFLLSNNFLVRTISRVIVEALRNTPLLVQLFIWFFIVMFSLPGSLDTAFTFPAEGRAALPIGRIIFYLVLALVVWRFARQYQRGNWRRRTATVGLIAAILMIEFILATGVSLSGGLFRAIYVILSVGLIAGAWFYATGELRGTALGVTVGQLVGGLLVIFGLLPNFFWRPEVYPAVYISVRGFVFPELVGTNRFADWLAFVAVGVALSIFLWLFLGNLNENMGEGKKRHNRTLYVIIAFLGLTILGWFFASAEPAPENIWIETDDGPALMSVEEIRADEALRGDLSRADDLLTSQSPLRLYLPERRGFRFASGSEVSINYMALFLGLSIYTAAFIAEIVRAGIQAVPTGQVEAARALGLNQRQVLSMVILPQALRVIIPPLGNQYLNLSKNSSLAIGIAYADLFLVTTTIMNQSGQSVTGMLLVMLTYLILSLLIALTMGLVNRRFQLVTR